MRGGGDHAFGAVPVGTKALAVTATTGSIVFNLQSSTNSPARHVLVTNVGTKLAFVEFGPSAVVAVVPTGSTAGGFPIDAGKSRIFVASGAYAAAICGGSDSTTLYFSPGEGNSA